MRAVKAFYFPGFTTSYVPQPQMDMAFNPANPSNFFIITDKEIVRTDDNGETYTFKIPKITYKRPPPDRVLTAGY